MWHSPTECTFGDANVLIMANCKKWWAEIPGLSLTWDWTNNSSCLLKWRWLSWTTNYNHVHLHLQFEYLVTSIFFCSEGIPSVHLILVALHQAHGTERIMTCPCPPHTQFQPWVQQSLPGILHGLAWTSDSCWSSPAWRTPTLLGVHQQLQLLLSTHHSMI